MDHLIFALNGIGAALRHLIIGQQLFHLTAHQADVVAIGDLSGDGDGTGLIFTVDGGSGRGLGHCGDLGKADLAFLLVFGTGQAELLQRFPGRSLLSTVILVAVVWERTAAATCW